MISKGGKAVNSILKATDKLRKAMSLGGDNLVKQKLRANGKKYSPPAFVEEQAELVTDMGLPLYLLGKGEQYVFYLHGGTYVDWPTLFHWKFVHRLSQDGVACLFVLYHKAPTYTCDTVVPEVADVLSKCISRYGNNITVIGDSAGGGLALATVQLLQNKGEALPQRLILFSPWLDVNMDNPDIQSNIDKDVMLNIDTLKTLGKEYLGNNDIRCPLACPLYGGAVQCPTHIFVGSDELMLADCAKYKRLNAQCESITVREFPSMQHCFCLMPIAEADEVYYEVLQLIKNNKN